MNEAMQILNQIAEEKGWTHEQMMEKFMEYFEELCADSISRMNFKQWLQEEN